MINQQGEGPSRNFVEMKALLDTHTDIATHLPLSLNVHVYNVLDISIFLQNCHLQWLDWNHSFKCFLGLKIFLSF